jgi:hypothetical protein
LGIPEDLRQIFFRLILREKPEIFLSVREG